MTDDDVDKQFVTAANVVIGKELNATSPPDSVGINRTGLGELIQFVEKPIYVGQVD